MEGRQLHISALKGLFGCGMLVLILLAISPSVYGQEGFKLLEDKEKDRYLSISGGMQFWLRYTALNPGSIVFEREQTSVWDLSIRRYRLRFSGKASEQLRFHFEFGNNDLNYYNAKRSRPHLLDAYVDYQLNEHFGFGFGKQAWAGLARYAAPSTTQALAYDVDFIAAPYVNVYDDLLRRMGIYARGTYQGLDYRVVLAKPSYYPYSSSMPISENASFSDRLPEYQLSTYLKYQFMEHESQKSPYAPGTYRGQKNILNLGMGMLHQPNTSWYLRENDTLYHTANSLAVDLFYEQILPKGRGLSYYLAYIHHQLGPNFMRFMGPNNPATAALPSAYVNGKGNAAPVIGTGHSWYLQLGYIRPAGSGRETQLQPYVSMAYSRFEALDDPALIYNAGLHFYLDGQGSKVTFGYQNRPVFKQEEQLISEEMRKGMLLVQYQILFGG